LICTHLSCVYGRDVIAEALAKGIPAMEYWEKEVEFDSRGAT